MGGVSLDRSLVGERSQAVQSADCLGCVFPNRNSFGGTIPAVQSVDWLDTYGGAFL